MCCAAPTVLRNTRRWASTGKDRAQDRSVDHAVPLSLLAPRNRLRGKAVMVGRGVVAAAWATPSQQALGVERILEHRHVASSRFGTR